MLIKKTNKISKVIFEYAFVYVLNIYTCNLIQDQKFTFLAANKNSQSKTKNLTNSRVCAADVNNEKEFWSCERARRRTVNSNRDLIYSDLYSSYSGH